MSDITLSGSYGDGTTASGTEIQADFDAIESPSNHLFSDRRLTSPSRRPENVGDQMYCPRCSSVKALADFHRNRSAPRGRHCWCKDCTNEKKRAERIPTQRTQRARKLAQNTDSQRRCSTCSKVLELTGDNFYISRSDRDGFQRNCKPCQKEHAKSLSPEQKEANWARRIERVYGISSERYYSMLAEQGGCRICGEGPVGAVAKLAVDHCHRTGRVRGLLCTKCNSAIGLLSESRESLAAAINYLEHFND